MSDNDKAIRLLSDLCYQAPDLPEARLVTMITDPESVLRGCPGLAFGPIDPDLSDFVERVARALLKIHRDAHRCEVTE